MPDHHELIRRARPGDDNGVWLLTREFATSFIPDRAAFGAGWAQLVAMPHSLLLVAESSGADVVGYLLAHSHVTLFANGPVAWVEEVMIEQGHRRSGIGRRRHVIKSAGPCLIESDRSASSAVPRARFSAQSLADGAGADQLGVLTQTPQLVIYE